MRLPDRREDKHYSLGNKVATIRGSNGNSKIITHSQADDVTSNQHRPDENSSMRDGPDPFASHPRVDEKLDELSDHSEFSGRGIDELSRRGIREQQRSLESLRAEFNEGLRAQQAMFLSARDEFETRQADTLANAWAVLENSLANMRSPAEVNSTSGRVAVETSPARSVENEVRIDSSRGEENRRRLSGNALWMPLQYL